MFRRRVIGSINISNKVDMTCGSKTYNGETQVATNITVTFKGNTLTEGVDYIVTENNGGVNVGSYVVKIKGIKKYSGEEQGTFSITKVTPTVTVPTPINSLVYNASAQSLINAGSTNFGTLKYSLDNSTYSTSIPSGTNATNYTIYYKVDGDSNINNVAAQSVSNSIAKVTPTVTAPTAKSLTYNGSAQALVNAGSTDWGTLQYSLDNSTYSTSIPSGTNATSYTVYYRVVGNSNINDVAANTVNVTIAKANPTYTAPTAKTGLTYTGSAQALLNAGSTSHGTIYYSSDNSTWSTSIPSGTNASTSIIVYWKLVGDNNHKDITSTSITCSIGKANPTYTAPTATSPTYNGSAQALLNAGSTSHGTIKYSSDGSTWGTTIPTGKNATAYTSYWKLDGDSNHNNITSTSISTTISKVTPTVTAPTAKSLTYNGSAQALVNAGSTNWGTLKYSLDSSTWSTSIPSGTNATSYTVYYKVDGDSNINNVAAKSISCTIDKANPTYTAPTAKSLTYTGNDQALLNAGSTSHGTIRYSSDNSTWSTSIPSGKTAGNYTSYWKLDGDSNHNNVASTSISTTISKANGSVTTAPTAKSLTFNNANQELVNAGSGTGTMMYKLDSGSWGTSIPSASAATSYTVYYKASASTNYNESASGSVSVTINKVTPTVTAPTAKVLTFNNANQVLANAGSTNYGTIQYCLNNSGGTYSTTVPSASAANVTYKVWYKVVGNSNVNDVAPASIDCSIAEKRVTTPTITLDPSSYTYSGSQCKPTPTVKDGSTVIPSSEYTVSYSNNTNAGTATVTISDVVAGNYYISGTTTFTINKAAGSVTTAPTAKSLTFNNTNQALVNAGSGTGTMMYKLDSGAWGTSIPTASAATSYTVYYKASASTNYNESASGSVSVTINKVTPTVTAPTAKSLTYNGSAQALVSAGSTNYGTLQYSSDNINWSTSIPSGTNATSYTVYYRVVGDSNINSVAAKSVSCSIGKADTTYTAPTAKNTTYNTSAQALLNAGAVTGGTIYYSSDNTNWSTTIPSQTNAGTYTTYWKITGDSNHNDKASASISTTISAKTVSSPTITLSQTAYTYSNSACQPTPTVKDGTTTISSGEYTVSYSNNVNVGTATCTITDKSGGNYTVSGSKTFTINCYSATAPTAKSLTYNTSAQALANAGSTSYGTMVYCSTSGGTFSTTIPTGTNAGSYEVWWKVTGNTNVCNTAATKVSCSIAAKTVSSPTITLSPSSYVYSNSACQPTPTVKDGSTTIASSEYTVSYSNNVNAGTATCTITDKSGGNYTVSGSKTFTINCYSATAPTARSLTYNTSSQTLVNAGSTSYGTMVYCSTSGGTFSTTIPTGTNAGSYEVWWKVTGNTNVCNTAATKVDCTIGAKSVTPTITLSQTSYTYSNSACQPTVTLKDGSTTIASSEYTVSYSNNTNVGTATATVTDKSGGNYSFNTTSSNFTIVCKSCTAPTAKSLTWNGSAQALVNAGSTSYGTMVYSTDNSTWSTSIPSGTNATSYTVYWKVTGNTNVCCTASSSVACSIAKAAMTYTAPKVTTYTYANTARALVSGASANGGSIQYCATSGGAYSTTVPTQTNAGTYDTWWKAVPDSNHSGGTSAAKLTTTINCYSATAPTAKNPNWTGSAQALVNAGSTSYGTVVYSTDNSTFNTTIPSGTSAGSYTVYWKVTGNTNVCQTTSASISCSIKQVAMSYTAPSAATRTYTGSAQQIVSGGSANGGNIYYATSSAGASSSTTVPSQTNAGTYTIYWKAVPDGNHSGGTSSWTAISCTIAKAAMTYSTPKAAVRTYNGSAQQIVSGGSATGGSIYYATSSAGASSSTTVPTQTNAGTYTIYWKAVPDGNHSGGTSSWTAISVTVNKASQSAPTATGATTTYNTTATATASGGGGQGSIEWSNGNTQTSVGSKTTKARWSGNSNYNASPYSNEVTLTMNKAAGNVSTAPTNSNPTYGSGDYLCTAGSGTGTMLYKLGSGSYSSTRPTTSGLNVGSYTLYYKASASTNYNESSERSITVTVAKATGSVTTAPTAKSLTYNGSAQALVNAGSGTGTMMYKLDSGSWGTSIPTATNATSYTVYYKASASTNYDESTSGSVNVTIAKASRTISFTIAPTEIDEGDIAVVTAEASAKDYGESIIVSSSNNNIASVFDFSSYDYNIPNTVSGISSGSCTITATILEGNNYLSASKSYSLSIVRQNNLTRYLTFTATNSGSFRFSGNSISYSLDNGVSWTSLASNTDSPTVSAGNKIMWKGTLNTVSGTIGKFSSSEKFTVGGNMMSLLYNDTFSTETSIRSKYQVFSNIFSGCTKMLNANNLVLPATTLANYCYEYMFYNCRNLKAGPNNLPTTNLSGAVMCYQYMFSGCRSLTTAPPLPATTLADYCYNYMFYNCTSLTTAPVLSTTTLASGCYAYMFYNCTSLTTAPSLPATALTNTCYQNMFMGCTSLTTAPSLPATALTSSCYSSMFMGCTSLTTAPSLPATRLAGYCYQSMFMDCTSLTTAPSLPALTLEYRSYYEMFYRCSNLNYIKAMFTTTPGVSYTGDWVYGVASSGTFVMNPNASWNTGTTSCGVSTYPCNWTVQTASS